MTGPRRPWLTMAEAPNPELPKEMLQEILRKPGLLTWHPNYTTMDHWPFFQWKIVTIHARDVSKTLVPAHPGERPLPGLTWYLRWDDEALCFRWALVLKSRLVTLIQALDNEDIHFPPAYFMLAVELGIFEYNG